MSSLSPANGSEEKVYKVQVLKLGQYVESHGRWFNFAFYKKMWPSNSAFEKDIWTQFWPRGPKFEQINLQKFKSPGGCSGEGMLNLGIDRRINHKEVRSLTD